MSEVKVIEVPEQGPPGNVGAQGAPGVDGRTVLYGSAAPSSAIGVDGDFYINTTTHFIYGPKQFGVWPAGTNLVGPTGPTGATGSIGLTGATGPQGLQGTQGGIRWNWSNSVTMADPGVGNLRFNNATLANVTAIAIDDQCAAPGNPDVSNFVLSWDDSSSGQKGYVVIQQSNDPATFLIFGITSITDNVGWTQLNGSVAGSAGAFTNGITIGVIWTRTGDVGTANILDNSLTLAKLVNTTQGNFITRVTPAGGAWEAVTIPAMSALVPAPGDLLLGVPAAGGAPRKVDVKDLPVSGLGMLPQGRLTLSANTPVMPGNVSGQTTVRYTPYSGLCVPVWNGTQMVAMNIAGELTQLLSDATKSPAAAVANKNYDMFAWLDGSTPRCTRGPAWPTDIDRGTGVGTSELSRVVGGLPVNANAITNGPAQYRGTYVGSIRTNGSTQVDFIQLGVGSGGLECKQGVWNCYNRCKRSIIVQDTQAPYSQSGNVIKTLGNSALNRISFLRGLDEDSIEFVVQSRATPGGSSFYLIGMSLDTTAALVGGTGMVVAIGISELGPNPGVAASNNIANGTLYTALGWHFMQATEQAAAALTVTLGQYNIFRADMMC